MCRLFLSLLLIGASGQFLIGQQQPGAAEGAKIGTIIRTAVQAALPGVSDLLGLIWGQRRDRDTLTREQLRTEIERVREELFVQAQEQIQPVRLLAEELRVINEFLESSVLARENVIRMQSRVPNLATSSQAWERQQEDWNVAKGELQRLELVPDADLYKIRDFWLRGHLRDIKLSNRRLVPRVDSRLKAQDTAGLNEVLRDLSNALEKITAAAGYVISDLRGDIQGLADWAQGAQAVEEFVPPEKVIFRKILEK